MILVHVHCYANVYIRACILSLFLVFNFIFKHYFPNYSLVISEKWYFSDYYTTVAALIISLHGANTVFIITILMISGRNTGKYRFSVEIILMPTSLELRSITKMDEAYGISLRDICRPLSSCFPPYYLNCPLA